MPELSQRKHPIRRVVAAVTNSVWALREDVLATMLEVLELRRQGYEFSRDEIQARLRSASGGLERSDESAGPRSVNGVAVLPLYGVLAPRMNLLLDISGGTSTQQFGAWFQQAMSDGEIKAIVLDIDSPGGDAAGNQELVDLIRSATADRGTKPVIAVATTMAASAAYWIATAAGEIVASPSAELGSIGVFMVHTEASARDRAEGLTSTVIRAGKYKATGNDIEPLSPEARGVLQERVDDSYRQFVRSVAANRGVSAERVEESFGQGKVMLAERALAAGLADRIATLDQVVAQLAERYAANGSGITAKTRRGGRSDFANSNTLRPARAVEEAGNIYAQREDKIVAEETQPTNTPPQADQRSAAGGFNPPPPPVNLQEIRRQEQVRIEDLQSRGRLLGIDEELIQQAVVNGTSVSEALLNWTNHLASSRPPVTRIQNGQAASDKFHAGALEALSRRCGIGLNKPASEFAKPLLHRNLLHIAELSLSAAGGRRADLDHPEDIAKEALRGDGREISPGAIESINRPGDFPNLLSNLAGKMLDDFKQYAPSTYKEWAYQLPSVADFKPHTISAFGEFAEMSRWIDSSKPDEATASEEASWISADRYGAEFKITPRMIVDDDLGAFSDAAMDMAIAAEMTVNRLCVDLLTGNAKAGDGVALFDDTSHGNDVTAGAVPSTTSLSTMRLKLRNQKGVSGKRKLGLNLYGLLIPNDQETTTEQLLANTLVVVPTTDATAMVFRGRVDYWVEPMLSDDSTIKWYGFANKMIARAIVYAFQTGYEQMRSRLYFDEPTQTRVLQTELRCGAAVRDWRGVVRNAGA